MSKVFHQLSMGLDEDLSEKLQYLVPNYSAFRVTRKSVDARKYSAPHFVYSVEVFEQNESATAEDFSLEPVSAPNSLKRPIIVGSGPAGLFAALRLVERGLPCLLLERGSEGTKRIQAINRFWRYNELDPHNNVCFGEGGAGLYSDGKLITRIKSPYIPYVMDRLIKFGAPEEIRYLANPHVGSDRIRRVIPKLREYLQSKGCEMRFDTPMKRLLVEGKQVVGVETTTGEKFFSEHVILATGHSAQDVFDSLRESEVFLEGKSFALGLRIEHPQKLINQIQYRKFAEHPALGSANYKLADHDHQSGVGVYSFCMCPGGYVLSSGTDADGVVVNGMSNYHRNSPFANAAIVVSIDHEKNFGADVYAGMDFRRDLEKKAWQSVQAQNGKQAIPVQGVMDFLKGRSGGALKSSSPSGVVPARLDQILPEFITERLRASLENFNQNMQGFISPEAQLHGIESRTSCPVRITRDPESLESVSHRGLYPCGEGAGYAGGITSAACDGIRIAEKIAERVSSLSSVSLKI